MVARLLQELPLELQENGVIEIEELDIGLDTLAHHGIGEVLGEADSVGLAVDAFGEALQVVLSVGVVDVGQQFGLMVHEVHSAAQQVPG